MSKRGARNDRFSETVSRRTFREYNETELSDKLLLIFIAPKPSVALRGGGERSPFLSRHGARNNFLPPLLSLLSLPSRILALSRRIGILSTMDKRFSRVINVNRVSIRGERVSHPPLHRPKGRKRKKDRPRINNSTSRL